MDRLIKSSFFKCGLAGWGFECFFTGIKGACGSKCKTLPCHTSLWMFFIYGMAALFRPLYCLTRHVPRLLRGIIYTCFIFLTEYITGSFLKKHDACPWDYSGCKHNYKGLIRLDYAPLWFVVGLIYEKMICCKKQT